MRERTKFRASLLDRLPNLKLIATTGMRNAAIDIEYAKDKGIMVSGAIGKGDSTIEHIWALILATARYLVTEDRNMKESKMQWQSTVPMGLSGRTLGLVGVGRLGSRTAKVRSYFIVANIYDEGFIVRLPKPLI
jgi:26S proteasome regulatory subunit N2